MKKYLAFILVIFIVGCASAQQKPLVPTINDTDRVRVERKVVVLTGADGAVYQVLLFMAGDNIVAIALKDKDGKVIAHKAAEGLSLKVADKNEKEVVR